MLNSWPSISLGANNLSIEIIKGKLKKSKTKANNILNKLTRKNINNEKNRTKIKVELWVEIPKKTNINRSVIFVFFLQMWKYKKLISNICAENLLGSPNTLDGRISNLPKKLPLFSGEGSPIDSHERSKPKELSSSWMKPTKSK